LGYESRFQDAFEEQGLALHVVVALVRGGNARYREQLSLLNISTQAILQS